MTAAALCRWPAEVPNWLCEVLSVAGWGYTVIAGVEEGSAGYARLARCPCCRRARTATVHLASGVLHCERRACPANRRVPSSTWVPGFVADAAPWLDWTWGTDDYPVQLTLDESKWVLPAMLEDIIAWTEAGRGHVGVQAVGPPGTGKTKVAIDRQVRADHGSLLAPNHRLRKELVERYRKAGGGDCVEFEGVLRLLEKKDPELARRAAAFQALGYSATDLLDVEDRPRATMGDGGSSFGVHHHLCHIPVIEADQGARESGHQSRRKRRMLRTPVIADELPPLLDTMRLEPRHVELLTARSQFDELDSWQGGRGAAATILLEALAILRERRAHLPTEKPAYADYLSGRALEKLLLQAAGSKKALLAAVEATPSLASRLLPPPPKPGDIFQATPFFRWPQLCPSPPKARVQSGEIEARAWPHRYTDFFLAALFAEASSLRLAGPCHHTACLVAAGRGSTARVWCELRRPWSLEVPRHYSLVVADATASYMEDAFRAAWPGRKVRYFRAEVLPAEPQATTRTWLRTGKTSFSRRALLHRGTGAESTTGVRPDAIPALIRVLLMATDQMQRHLGDGKKLGMILPKPVVALFRASLPPCRRSDKEEGAGEEAKIPKVEPNPRLRAVLDDLFDSGQLGGLLTAHQGATCGTNTLEGCDALLTMPFTPNLGAVFEDARALDIDPEAHLEGLMSVELIQASHRLRSVRATLEKPRLLLHVGPTEPPDWPLDGGVVEMPPGGPVPTSGSVATRQLVEGLLERHRAVSAALIRLIATEPEWYARAAGLSTEDATAAAKLAEAVGAVSKSTIERTVRAATSGAWSAPVPNPCGHGRRWTMKEVEIGAAARLVERLDASQEGKDAS